jgi:sporadic carbohydrate cluster 2OG-Fe(II) oxygenase
MQKKTFTIPNTSESNFDSKGYAIVPASDFGVLNELRQTVYRSAVELLSDIEPNSTKSDITEFFDQFHLRDLTEALLNDYRLELISRISSAIDVGEAVFKSFENTIEPLLGPDIVVQRGTNLVIQQPGDINVSPVHRDAPMNSHFEIVCWIPFNHCFATKGMLVLDKAQSEHALELLADPLRGFDSFADFAMTHGNTLDVPYGHALIFWTGLVHAVPINREDSTRWSMNIRYKNFFSPFGSKGLPDFFRILKLSPLTRLALNAERTSLLSNS